MSKNHVVVPLYVDDDQYFVHAKIIGGFWNGYIVHDNKYFMSLPSASSVDNLIFLARQNVERRREEKRRVY